MATSTVSVRLTIVQPPPTSDISVSVENVGHPSTPIFSVLVQNVGHSPTSSISVSVQNVEQHPPSSIASIPVQTVEQRPATSSISVSVQNQEQQPPTSNVSVSMQNSERHPPTASASPAVLNDGSASVQNAENGLTPAQNGENVLATSQNGEQHPSPSNGSTQPPISNASVPIQNSEQHSPTASASTPVLNDGSTPVQNAENGLTPAQNGENGLATSQNGEQHPSTSNGSVPVPNSGQHPPTSIGSEISALSTWEENLRQTLTANVPVESADGSAKCIHRVPPLRRGGNDADYVPKKVSIGPIYNGDGNTRDMESHKWRFVKRRMLSRAEVCEGDPLSIRQLKIYFSDIEEVAQMAKNCYSQVPNLDNLDTNQFILMLVADGCFILELFCMDADLIKAKHHDPIFRDSLLMSQLRNDFLLFENQIPFFVLQNLYNKMEFRAVAKPSLISITLQFFKKFVPWIEGKESEDRSAADPEPLHSDPEPLHLLDLVRSSLLVRPSLLRKIAKNGPLPLEPIPNAAQLQKEKIKFKKGDASIFLDINFDRGVLKIPSLSFHGYTRTLFLNLIAYEQCYRYTTDHISVYTTFMNRLLRSEPDAAILRGKGIIDGSMGNNNEVVSLFNKGELIIDKNFSPLSDVCNKIIQHRRNRNYGCCGSF